MLKGMAMKRIVAVMLILCLVIACTPAFAARGSRRGASAQAYEHASDEAIFNRVGDWFATRGKSEEEKAKILTERKAKRAAKRAEKEAKKTQKEAEKKIKKSQKKANKGIKKKLGR